MTTGTVKWFNAQKGFSAVERAGLTARPDEQKPGFKPRQGQRGKTSAINLELQ